MRAIAIVLAVLLASAALADFNECRNRIRPARDCDRETSFYRDLGVLVGLAASARYGPRIHPPFGYQYPHVYQPYTPPFGYEPYGGYNQQSYAGYDPYRVGFEEGFRDRREDLRQQQIRRQREAGYEAGQRAAEGQRYYGW